MYGLHGCDKIKNIKRGTDPGILVCMVVLLFLKLVIRNLITTCQNQIYSFIVSLNNHNRLKMLVLVCRILSILYNSSFAAIWTKILKTHVLGMILNQNCQNRKSHTVYPHPGYTTIHFRSKNAWNLMGVV